MPRDLLVSLVTVVAFLIGCSGAPPAAPTAPSTAAPTLAPAPKPTVVPTGVPVPAASGGAPVVKIGLLQGTGNSPMFVAKGRGYFDKQGLDVQFVPVSSGAELLPLLASAQLDAGVSSPGAALFNAIGNNVPLKAVLDMGRDEPGSWWGGMVVRPDLLDSGAIKAPADLKGKTIAVTGPGVATYLNAITLLESAVLTEKDVNITSMTFPDMISALGTKKIDAAEVVEPALTLGEEQGVLRRWMSNAEISPGQQEVVMMVTPKFAANKDVADRFMLALVEGLHEYRAAFGPEKKDQEAVIAAVLPLLGNNYTADILRKIRPLGLDANGFVNGDSLKQQQDWYAAHGFIKTPVNIDDVVDNSFAERAKDGLNKR
jgi:NitT/TauT family transport system substrate-binding protein